MHLKSYAFQGISPPHTLKDVQDDIHLEDGPKEAVGCPRILGFDVGDRRIGVAVSDPLGLTAQPLLTIHRARQTYDPTRSFNAWLRVIAERRAIDLLRQVRRHGARELHAPVAFESYPDHGADPARGVEHAQAAGRVKDALANLPAGQREAVEALVLREQSLAEASITTRRSKSALKVNLHRALKALRGKLERTE